MPSQKCPSLTVVWDRLAPPGRVYRRCYPDGGCNNFDCSYGLISKIVQDFGGFFGGEGTVSLQRNPRPTWLQCSPGRRVNLPFEIEIPYQPGGQRSQGSQALARHCYNIVLQRSDQSDLCPVDGLDARDDLIEERGGPIEDLVPISLNDGNAEHVVMIGSNLGEEVRMCLKIGRAHV